MTTYRRPAIAAVVFRDPEGRVIDYGNRWDGDPPEDSYSIDTHPERFTPLHTVADALVEHLRATFDVEIHAEQIATDPVNSRIPALRAVHVTPADPRCAPLTFVFTEYPGIVLHAGLLHSFHYPHCGCDACDESWESQADELESDVLAVAAGGYQESVRLGRKPRVGYSITTRDGGRSTEGTNDVPHDRIRAAEPVLRTLGGAWAPWPGRG